MKATLLRLRTTNDTNGNPRRTYAICTDFQRGTHGGTGWAKRTIYVDEGYEGRDAYRPLGIKPKRNGRHTGVREVVAAWFDQNAEGTTVDVCAAHPDLIPSSVGSAVTNLRKKGTLKAIRKEGRLFVYTRAGRKA